VAVFLGWLLAGEELNARIGLAAAIIVGAVILINWARQASARKEAVPVIPQEIE
ncbi:MAG: multidrug transporter, partial [Anaerolineales bacterium]|nr:multidrug transporter [Anaerolineales bacterium]